MKRKIRSGRASIIWQTGDSIPASYLYTVSEYRSINPSLVSNISLESIRLGKMPSHYLVNSCDINDFDREISIVDFRGAFTIPLSILYKLLNSGRI